MLRVCLEPGISMLSAFVFSTHGETERRLVHQNVFVIASVLTCDARLLLFQVFRVHRLAEFVLSQYVIVLEFDVFASPVMTQLETRCPLIQLGS